MYIPEPPLASVRPEPVAAPMNSTSSVLVVNTSSITGWEVESYIGPISVHMVAGTNIFSDLFASFSDIFGGRSESYGNQLSRLYEDAVEQLRRRARAAGANVVLGLTIDFDEISGQGKSMFMLNAVGTAVRARRTVAGGTAAAAGAPLPFDRMEVLIRRNRLLSDIRNKSLVISDEVWEFATEHAVAEMSDYALGSFLGLDALSDSPHTMERAVRFFNALDPEVAKDRLYLMLRHTSAPRSAVLREAIVQILVRLHLVDYRRITAALDYPEAVARKEALRVLKGHPGTYRAGDLDDAVQLREAILRTFPPRWTPTTRRGLLGGEKPAFACPCGGVAVADDAHCPKCHLDTYGFARAEFSRDEAVTLISDRIAVLQEIYAPG